jgi:DNA-binding Lrp family transcriptional regulator
MDRIKRNMAKAYVLIVNEPGTEDSVISNLSKIPSITDAYGIFGTYDILTKLESYDKDIIQNDITNGIRKISKIRSTLTLLVNKKLEILKANEIEQKVLDEHIAQAFILTVHRLKSDEPYIVKRLQEIPEVIEADLLIGYYEIICKVSAPSYNDISKIVTNKIRKILGIKSTITMNVINKQGFSR